MAVKGSVCSFKIFLSDSRNGNQEVAKQDGWIARNYASLSATFSAVIRGAFLRRTKFPITGWPQLLETVTGDNWVDFGVSALGLLWEKLDLSEASRMAPRMAGNPEAILLCPQSQAFSGTSFLSSREALLATVVGNG
jgi:hypothetical protein